MPTRELLIFIGLSLVAAGIVIAAVTVFQRSHHPANVSAPAVHVEDGKDLTKEAPPATKPPVN